MGCINVSVEAEKVIFDQSPYEAPTPDAPQLVTIIPIQGLIQAQNVRIPWGGASSGQIQGVRANGTVQNLLRINSDDHVIIGASGQPGGTFIYGVTSGSGSNVVINSSGRLYTTGSSRRFKENISYDIDKEFYHNALMRFKTAEFNFKGEDICKLGMIAEDVEEQCSIAALYEDEPIYADDSETVTGFKRTGNVNNYDDRAIIQMLVMEVQRLNEIIERNNLK